MNNVHTLYMIIYVVDVTCGCLLFLLSMLKIQFIRLLDLNMDVGPWVKRLKLIWHAACLKTKCTKSRFAVKPHTNILWSFDRCLLGDLQMVMSHDP